MRDLIRNYKNILAGKSLGSDSDGESQPLSSSYASSSSSFGSIFGPSSESGEPERDIEDNRSPEFSSKKSLQSALFENPQINTVYTALPVLNNYGSFPKISGGLTDNGPMVQQEPKAFKSPPSSGSYDIYPDYKEEEKHTHHSLVTIFAIWNTTMGSSLLAMSWGIHMAGLVPGIAINIAVAAICLYTCYMLLKIYEKHGMSGEDIEVSHLCLSLLGKWAEVLAKVFSVIVLFGANIVYMILMSNFLYNSVYFLHALILDPGHDSEANQTILCPKEAVNGLNTSLVYYVHNTDTLFDQVWDLYGTVPIYLAVIMFAVLNFKSPTFFAKFNCLGTISVMYLLAFVAVKAAGWGINFSEWQSEFSLKPTFPALSGMLSLSYFIHNIIVSIMKNNKHQEHNGRDLSIAFGLITFTYLFIGVVFYVSFPLAKNCIADNIFNNFTKRDTMTIVARLLLMFQLFTVFPLIAFMLRNDILRNVNDIFTNHRFGDFTYCRVAFINVFILVVCVLFACLFPKIGTLIRYTGALSGLVYIFMLPNLLKLSSLKKEGELTVLKSCWHIGIIVIGTLNLISQFFIND